MLKNKKNFLYSNAHTTEIPNRDKINKDVVGAVKVIYTTKTKTKRQCKKRILCYAVACLLKS